jgi:hypothetical protein
VMDATLVRGQMDELALGARVVREA